MSNEQVCTVQSMENMVFQAYYTFSVATYTQLDVTQSKNGSYFSIGTYHRIQLEKMLEHSTLLPFLKKIYIFNEIIIILILLIHVFTFSFAFANGFFFSYKISRLRFSPPFTPPGFLLSLLPFGFHSLYVSSQKTSKFLIDNTKL